MLFYIKILLNFIVKDPNSHIPALAQILAWRRIGDRPLSEQMTGYFTDEYIRHFASMN